jgi:CheY-like chemotaxis protein
MEASLANILVVDEDWMMRVCMIEILTNLGHTVIEAEDGLEALQIYQRRSKDISIVIMDSALPRLNGEEVSRIIRKIDSSAKIVLVSKLPEIPLRNGLADAWLPRSFNNTELRQVVKSILEGN